MAVVQDLGLVTSYGYAVAGGFIGDEEEYKVYLANLGHVSKDADASALKSESYAVGGTGIDPSIHPDEDTDNSKYYSEISASYARGNTGKRSGEDTDNSEYWSKMSSSYAKGGTGLRQDEATDNANYYNRLAKSWAVGGTGERTGEATDNSKYWSTQATISASSASGYATDASSYAANARISEQNASGYEQDAKQQADIAKGYKEQAQQAQNQATIQVSYAEQYKDQSQDAAKISESWAVGHTGERANEDINNSNYWSTRSEAWSEGTVDGTPVPVTDPAYQKYSKYWSIYSKSWAQGDTGIRDDEANNNAMYWAEQAQAAAEGIGGALFPMGTVTFAQLPAIRPSSPIAGAMYNVSDAFTTTSDFEEGEGHEIPAGSNVYMTVHRKWDVLAGSPVSGVKGEAELTYRTGNVNIRAVDVGANRTYYSSAEPATGNAGDIWLSDASVE